MVKEGSLLVPADRREWREWLEVHHDKAADVWIAFYKKGVREGSLTLDEAVEEALCFGWIDGRLKGLNAEQYSLRFSPRRAGSVWSVSNIRRVERLVQEGLMTAAGLEKVEEGRKSGQWEAAILRERTEVIPPDLLDALERREGAVEAYRCLTDSRKKQYLHWLYTAKRPETRQKRLEAIVSEVAG